MIGQVWDQTYWDWQPRQNSTLEEEGKLTPKEDEMLLLIEDERLAKQIKIIVFTAGTLSDPRGSGNHGKARLSVFLAESMCESVTVGKSQRRHILRWLVLFEEMKCTLKKAIKKKTNQLIPD